MGFWDKVGKVAGVLIEKAPGVMETMVAKGKEHQAKVIQNQARQINQYERKLQNAERNSGNISQEKREKIEQARKKLEEHKKNLGVNVSNTGEILYGDYTINEWNSRWKSIGSLRTVNLTPYNKYVGLYRHVMGGKIMYVGRAIELNNGGFRKRLSDYSRESDSARKHKSGRLINENLDRITTDILIVGDTQEAVKVTQILEGQFIAKFNPPWNKQINI